MVSQNVNYKQSGLFSMFAHFHNSRTRLPSQYTAKYNKMFKWLKISQFKDLLVLGDIWAYLCYMKCFIPIAGNVKKIRLQYCNWHNI